MKCSKTKLSARTAYLFKTSSFLHRGKTHLVKNANFDLGGRNSFRHERNILSE
jgi:hypothetical protein